MYRNSFTLILLLSVGLLSSAWALRTDRQQPIDIKADRVEIDERKEVSHYYGNVHMEQGSLKIRGDEVVVYLQDGILDKIVIFGKPAHFEQLPDDRKTVVESKAEHMEYFASKELLVLHRNAEVTQGRNLFRGDLIEYDTRKSTVRATRDAGSEKRVHAIIQPAGDNEDEASPASGDKP